MKKSSILVLATVSLFGLPLFADGEEEVKEPFAVEETTVSSPVEVSYNDSEEEADSRLALRDDEEEADSRLALSDDEEEADSRLALNDDDEEAESSYIS